MEILGTFKNHDRYDGVFLGFNNLDWHLEFTQSDHKANHYPDKDDLIVLYLPSQIQIEIIKAKAIQEGLHWVKPKNPYWQKNGHQINDPDGYGIILALKDIPLNADDMNNHLLTSKGINSWSHLLQYVRDLPYGRNSDRANFDLVISENCGTCSSKHALAKKIADLNNIDVQLIIGIYKMDASNTPGIGSYIADASLDYLPEAHCYLKSYGCVIDLTSDNSFFHKIEDGVMEEIEIKPDDVISYKVDYHKSFLKKWISKNDIPYDFSQIWKIREECIASLVDPKHKK